MNFPLPRSKSGSGATARIAIAAAIAAALALPTLAQASSFQLPVGTAASLGRAGAGGSLYDDDPTAAYSNPAALAFISGTVHETTFQGLRPSAKFNGSFTDYAGNPISGSNPNGFGRPKFMGNGASAFKINDHLVLGTSFNVPYALSSNYNSSWQGRYFGTRTAIRNYQLTLSAGIKVNDEFSMGVGVVGSYTRATIGTTIDAGSTASLLGLPLKPQSADVDLNVNAKRSISVGYVVGFEFKPTDQDRIGASYHSRIQNRLSGDYTLGGSATGLALLSLAMPGVSLNGHGSAKLDLPATANFDYLHIFSPRWTLGASAQWTGWSSFKSLALSSNNVTLVTLPENFKDAWMYSIGGDYRFTDRWTLHAGIAYDESPSINATRDPRLPDGTRKIVAVGFGYQATRKLKLDLGYQHQFVNDVRVSQQNQALLGAGIMDGYYEDSGDVVSLTATYHF
ncbi:OmpP1/FadL family transporter [Frateuria aurantia]